MRGFTSRLYEIIGFKVRLWSFSPILREYSGGCFFLVFLALLNVYQIGLFGITLWFCGVFVVFWGEFILIYV